MHYLSINGRARAVLEKTASLQTVNHFLFQTLNVFIFLVLRFLIARIMNIIIDY